MKKLMPLISFLIFPCANANVEWGIGIGGIIEDEGYVDVGSEANVIPVIYVKTERFTLLGPQFSYRLFETDAINISAVGNYRLDGFEEDDGDFLNGLEERKGALDLGAEIEFETDLGDFSVQFTTDATSEHEGNQFTVAYSKNYMLEHGMITPFVSISRLSDDLVDYYYGVRQSEATLNRPFYLGESTTNVTLGINSNWQWDKQNRFVANLSVTALGSEIEESPLIDASTNVQFILGYLYVF